MYKEITKQASKAFWTAPEIEKIDGWYTIQSKMTDKFNNMIKEQSIMLNFAIVKWCSNETLKELIEVAENELELRKVSTGNCKY